MAVRLGDDPQYFDHVPIHLVEKHQIDALSLVWVVVPLQIILDYLLDVIDIFDVHVVSLDFLVEGREEQLVWVFNWPKELLSSLLIDLLHLAFSRTLQRLDCAEVFDLVDDEEVLFTDFVQVIGEPFFVMLH